MTGRKSSGHYGLRRSLRESGSKRRSFQELLYVFKILLDSRPLRRTSYTSVLYQSNRDPVLQAIRTLSTCPSPLPPPAFNGYMFVWPIHSVWLCGSGSRTGDVPSGAQGRCQAVSSGSISTESACHGRTWPLQIALLLTTKTRQVTLHERDGQPTWRGDYISRRETWVERGLCEMSAATSLPEVFLNGLGGHCGNIASSNTLRRPIWLEWSTLTNTVAGQGICWLTRMVAQVNAA